MKSFSIKRIFVFALLLGCATVAHSQQQKVKPSQRSFRNEMNEIREKQSKRQDYIRKMQSANKKGPQHAATPAVPSPAPIRQDKVPVSRQPMVMDKHQNPKKQ